MRAFFYVLLYLLNISLFAIVYSKMPNAFYHNYIAHDHSFLSKIHSLTSSGALCEILNKANNSNYHTVTLGEGCSILVNERVKKSVEHLGKVKSYYLRTPYVFEKKLIIPIRISFYSESIKETVVYHDELRLQKASHERLYLESKLGDNPLLALVGFIDNSTLYAYSRPKYSLSISDITSGSYIDELKSIASYLEDGKVEKETLLGRMFYFSFITASSIGYGDIVPISNYARWLICIETILSLVIVGFLLKEVTKTP